MKKIVALLIFGILLMPIFALPGFEPYLPDNAGDYVYYKDESFERESYVGILRYDEATYQLRYYAPMDKSKYLPEKNIALLLTVDSEKNYMELTGERIISTIMPDTEDTDLVNYLHDLFYELSSRRIKIDPIEPDDEDYKTEGNFWAVGKTVRSDYPQFGGVVKIVYDVMIPLFNVKRIVGPDGHDIFYTVTFGTLSSSMDTSFDSFNGKTTTVPEMACREKINTKAKKVEYKLDERTITLDENWTQGMENLWLLGNAALISASTIPMVDSLADRYDYYVIRRLIMSSQDSYIDAQSITLQKNKNGYTISINIYQPQTDNIVRNVKKLSQNKTGSYDLLLFTAFQADYAMNKKYFDGLLNKN